MVSGSRSDLKHDARSREREMPYQYVREPLRADESDLLSDTCEISTERLVVWTLLDPQLRVGELCCLSSKDVLERQSQLRVEPAAVGPYCHRCQPRFFTV